jgi:16S rRNA (guanine966-N2)-methyltransferase
MRIIAGKLKGRQIQAPVGQHVRPTSDQLRETLFNVLAGTVPGARVLDAFAGTGALGIEAWSRGASDVTFVEQDPRVHKVLLENLRVCGMLEADRFVAEACAIIRADFLSTPAIDTSFDLVLLDPPYDVERLEDVVNRGSACAAEGGLMVLEHSRRRESPVSAESFTRYRVLTAGDSALSFYARNGAAR